MSDRLSREVEASRISEVSDHSCLRIAVSENTIPASGTRTALSQSCCSDLVCCLKRRLAPPKEGRCPSSLPRVYEDFIKAAFDRKSKAQGGRADGRRKLILRPTARTTQIRPPSVNRGLLIVCCFAAECVCSWFRSGRLLLRVSCEPYGKWGPLSPVGPLGCVLCPRMACPTRRGRFPTLVVYQEGKRTRVGLATVIVKALAMETMGERAVGPSAGSVGCPLLRPWLAGGGAHLHPAVHLRSAESRCPQR